jgi:hypothetical protein
VWIEMPGTHFTCVSVYWCKSANTDAARAHADEETAEKAVAVAKLNGTPVRSGKPGYRLPRMVRIAVRSPELTRHLLDGWQKAFVVSASARDVSPVDATDMTEVAA